MRDGDHYGSEARRDASAWLMEIVAAPGALQEGSAGAVLHGELERGHRSAVIFTFGGGNNEIQREIISWIGLGMPRVRRWPEDPRPRSARSRRPPPRAGSAARACGAAADGGSDYPAVGLVEVAPGPVRGS
ncbi:hypothetical protein RKD18_000958 [Streptomyces phaeoluteigriseus]